MLLELTLYQTYYNQACLNRWNYVMSGTPAAASPTFALAYAMGFIPDGTPPAWPTDALFYDLRVLQSTSVAYQEVRSINVYDTTDFYTLPFVTGVSGLNGGETNSPTVAYGFRSSQVDRAIRRGFKRFVGVSENYIQSGGELNSSGVGAANNVADSLAATLTYDDEGNTLTFTPCVVSKEKYIAPSGRDAYRYYPTLAEQMTHVAQGGGWAYYPNTRTQRSRQY